jgi:hypothetical protein
MMMISPITIREMGEALALAAVHDNREVGPVELKVWVDEAREFGWSVSILRRVIREHYATGADRPRITPAHVNDRLRRVRQRALEIFDADRPVITDGETPDQHLARYRAEREMFANELVGLWASAGTDPEIEHKRRQLANRPAAISAPVTANPGEP